MAKRKNEMTKEERDLFDNSIERVINTTINILEHLPIANLSKRVQEDIDINLQDWHDLKETTVYWWNDKRNELFKKYNDQIINNNINTEAKLAAAEDGPTSLNIIVKRHIALLGKMHSEGKRVLEAFEGYIADATKEGFVVLSNANELYDVFVDNSGRPVHSNEDYKQSHSYKVMVHKIKRIIQKVIDDKDLKPVIAEYYNGDEGE